MWFQAAFSTKVYTDLFTTNQTLPTMSEHLATVFQQAELGSTKQLVPWVCAALLLSLYCQTLKQSK